MSKLSIKPFFIFSLFLFFVPCAAAEYKGNTASVFEQRRIRMEKMLDERLKLTPEQKECIRNVKLKNKEEKETIITKMQAKHKEIKNVYESGISKFQADLITASLKMELALLKQNAYKIKESERREIENILTPEQKNEIEKIKTEHGKNNKNHI